MPAAGKSRGAAGSTITAAILEAALRVIARGGVDAVRYREVAREADVPLGTISYHFPARDDLIDAAFHFFLDESTATVKAVRARLPGATLEELSELLTDLARTYLRDRVRCLAEYELMVYAARVPELSEALAEWDRTRQTDLALALEELEVKRPNATAQTLFELIRGFQLSSLGHERPDLEGLQRRVLALLSALVSSDAR